MFVLLIISDDGRSVVGELYDKHHRRMLYTATKILGFERGEEVVHDVFLRLLEKHEKNIEDFADKPGQYFVIIVRNHSLNIIKRERLETIPLEEDYIGDEIFQPGETDPEGALLSGEALDRLVTLIQRLTPATRQVLEYKYIEGYSNIEISGILGISQSAVSSRIEAARKRLQYLIENEGAADNG